MRTSDHPAAKPRQYRPPVFRADDEPEVPAMQSVATDPDVGLSTPTRTFEASVVITDENGDEFIGIDPAYREPTREPIQTAPRDGTYVRAFWGPDDEEGRLVRWRLGRHFNNRRWVTGGAWAPADGMIPLPAEPPTEWLKPPEEPEPEEGEEPEQEEEEAA